ncbi:MAG: hypothetical protein J4G00_00395 [Actinomycetia bacterium]|nr:hypothetical protein [Actinomycetes bacterium]
MQNSEGGEAALTPEESWGTIHTTMDRARSSMYLAGTSSILLLWAALTAVMYLMEYWLQTGGSDLAEQSPWVRAPLYSVLLVGGIIGSGIIGNRAGNRNVSKDVARAVGIRVFSFWITVTMAAWIIPAAAGMWNAEGGPQIPHVAIGIVTLGYILYGVMTHPALAGIGVGIAAAYYVPHYLAGEAAPVVSAVATLAVVGGGAMWLRRIGIR